MSNSSSFNEFLLRAFADSRELQLLHFSLFLGVYLAALLGNGLIITAIASDHHLHTPMYFFLLSLSVLDLGTTSTTVPKSMANSLRDTRAISYLGCAAQVFLVVFLFTVEYILLTVMAYDRFIAICKPLHYRTIMGQMSNSSSLNEFLLLAFANTWNVRLLHFSLFLGIYLAALLGNGLIITALHYGTLMGSRACVRMAAAAWASGFLNAVLHTANTFSIPLCQGNTVEQFFCEIPQILKLSCAESYLREIGLLVVSACLFFGCFIFIVVSYVQIFTAVLRIPSEQGRHKAFSMCLPHLAVVSLYVSTDMFAYLKPPSLSSPALDLGLAVLYVVVPPGRHKAFSMCLPHLAVVSLCVSTALFAYLKPPSISSPAVDLVVAVLYSVVPPTVNPLIYSMRNKELKDALKRLIQWVEDQQQ
ncbi:olfactory receptor 14A16-like [Dromaius novaehollandiae]|uniref:olfactory receptor 14A16-like n=1 Tax=Dromaius novaehollandiae TaxID=8790 RepID=UPI00311FE163